MGNYLVSTDVCESQAFKATEFVTWFQQSEKVRGGFCAKGGSTLHFDPVIGTDWTYMVIGAYNQLTEVKTETHTFVSQKGVYYNITDERPQNESSGHYAHKAALFDMDGLLLDTQLQYLKIVLTTCESFGLLGVEQLYYDCVSLRLANNHKVL